MTETDSDKWQKRILRKRNELKKLITHGQTIGNYFEVLVRRFLKMKLSDFKVGYGHVQSIEGKNSPQMDIIVYDDDIEKPIFKDNELIVVSCKSVKAVIEIRAIFGIRIGWKELGKLCDMVLKVQEICTCPIYYLCLDSDKYTHKMFDLKSIRKTTGLDDFFILQARKYPVGAAPRGMAKERKYIQGELQRLVEALIEL